MLVNVLHINQDFPYQTAHRGIVSALSATKSWDQTVYVPDRARDDAARFDVADEPFDVIVSQDFRQSDRVRQRYKSKKIAAAIDGQLDVGSFDLIHAHTLVAAGDVASVLSHRHDVPFVSSVRNTDLNTFLKHPILFGRLTAEIARQTAAIISINPSYDTKLDQILRPYLPSGT